MQRLVYGCSGDRVLEACVYLPLAPEISGAGIQPAHGGAVIDVHGGAWYRGTNEDGRHYGTELARLGWLVIAPQFRDAGNGGQHPDACQDIAACVRYVRTHSAHFGIDPQRISLMGSSSGGHLAMLCAVLADCAEFAGTQMNVGLPGAPYEFVEAPAGENVGGTTVDEVTAGAAITASVNGVAALWPVADPLYRYHYAQENDRPELIAGHDAYFGSEAAMQKASVPRVVESGEATQLPPLFVVQPGSDANVPRAMTEHLVRAWEAQGGLVNCGFYPAMPHGFACRAGGLTARCIHDVHSFLLGCSIAEQPKPD